MKRIDCVAVDLDGTLVDSVPDLAAATNVMLRTMGRDEFSVDVVRKWVGNGVPRLVERALVGNFDGTPDKALFDEGLPIFLDAYQASVCDKSACYEGVETALETALDLGVRLACVTNKSEAFTLPLLEKLGIRQFFEIVVSGDSLPKKKPDPAPLLHIARNLGQNPINCALIGDSVSDIKAAKAAGFRSVIVTYGYNQGLNLADYEPDQLVDSFADAVVAAVQ